MTFWSEAPTAFQIENLEPNREIGPARALARSLNGPRANSKGKAKGKYKGKNASGWHVYEVPGGLFVGPIPNNTSSDSEIESS